MTAASAALAKQIADLARRVTSVERSSQTLYRSFETAEGEEVDVSVALEAAIAAQATADQSQDQAIESQATADEATFQASTALVLAGAKNSTYLGPTPPDGLTVDDAGDLWIDTSTGNTLNRWDGDSWESVQDAAIAAASAAASAAQTTADGKGKVYYQTTPPASGTAADVWFDTDNDNAAYRWNGTAWVPVAFGNTAIANLDAGKITTGYLAAGRIAADTIDANMIQAGAIGTAELAASAVTAGKIAAGAVTADRLSVGAQGVVLAVNGSFEDADSTGVFPAGWTTPSGLAAWWSVNQRSGSKCLGLGKSASVGAMTSTFPVAAGDVITARCFAKAASAITDGFTFVLNFYDASGTALGFQYVKNNVGLSTTYAEQSGQVTAPANAVTGRVLLYNNYSGPDTQVYVDDVDVRKVIAGVQIADGAVSAQKLTATAIDGKTITGATLQTAASGKRVVITATGGTNTIDFWPGVTVAEEGRLSIDVDLDGTPFVDLSAPVITAGDAAASIRLTSANVGLGSPYVSVALNGDYIGLGPAMSVSAADAQIYAGYSILADSGLEVNGSLTRNGVPIGDPLTYGPGTPNGAAVGSSLSTMCSLAVPAQSYARTFIVMATYYLDKATPADGFEVRLYDEGLSTIYAQNRDFDSNVFSGTLVTYVNVPASTAKTFYVRGIRVAGSGTATPSTTASYQNIRVFTLGNP